MKPSSRVMGIMISSMTYILALFAPSIVSTKCYMSGCVIFLVAMDDQLDER